MSSERRLPFPVLAVALAVLGMLVGGAAMRAYDHHHGHSTAQDMQRMAENLACSAEGGRPGCARTVTDVRLVSPDVWRLSYNDPENGPSCFLVSVGGGEAGDCQP